MPEPTNPESAPIDQAQEHELSPMPAEARALDSPEAMIPWLEELIEGFEFDVIGLARNGDKPHYPLPTEPGTLANILETSAAGYLEDAVSNNPAGVSFRRGGQREYPDIELSGGALHDQAVALDIKVARRGNQPVRAATEWRTKSRITLLTGDTYFARPEVKQSSLPRPYGEYAFHLDWVIVFSIDENAEFPEVTELEHVIAETWRIASKTRSSTTRNYIGAINAISDLKAKRGEFTDRGSFEAYWRNFDWTKKATKEEVGEEAVNEEEVN